MKKKLNFSESSQAFLRSRRHLSGGVSSGLRAMSKPLPLFFRSGSGSHLIDLDGNSFTDYTLAWGPLILGHCDPELNQAVIEQLSVLQQVGAQHALEWEVAEQICRLVPCAEQVIFSNTGSEAVQIAFRLARAYTGRKKIIRFEGHYHGWLDNVLPGYHPDPADKLPSEGMSQGALDEVIVLPWNRLDVVESVLRQQAGEVAAIITEPILCNSGCVMPQPGYLEGLRELATRFGALLIFDEVITGFRVALGGAQALFGVTPDLATFAKAIAGGFPLSVIAGKREILQLVEARRVVHAGTFNGNPVSLAAARAVLIRLERNSGAVLNEIRDTGSNLIEGIRRLASEMRVAVLINGVGAVFHLSFTSIGSMKDYRDTQSADSHLRDEFLEAMLDAGIYLLPDGRWYVSTAHTLEDVEATLQAVQTAFSQLSASAALPLSPSERSG
jgi:glutamate-1-semialdehyde 2,1-aminomutase